jgi:hypothetical protein
VAADPETEIITDEKLTRAAGTENSDPAVAEGTGDLRGAICDVGHRAVIKPKPLLAPVKGGFTVR